MNTDEISFQTVALVEFSFNLRGAKDVHPSVKAGRVRKEEGSFLQKVLSDWSECGEDVDEQGVGARVL